MLKVLVVSRNESDNILLEKKLSPISKELGRVQYYSSRPASLSNVLDNNFNLLVYNCLHFNSSMRNNVSHWRSLGYLGPIMILVKVPDPSVLSSYVDLQNVTIIEKPYENKDLQGIAVKYIMDAKVAQRKHRRFETQQKALLESYNSDYSSYTTISNISKGGAHIEGDLNNMSKGDLLRVCFELDELKKNHTMSAKVVWTSGDVGSPDRTAGLQFISKTMVYDSLLNGI